MSTGSCCARLQKTNDAALGSLLLRCDCLRIRIQRDPAGHMAKQFCVTLMSVLLALNNEEYVCRKVCHPMCCVIPILVAAGRIIVRIRHCPQ